MREENKGRRDALISLHPLAVEHLQALKGFDPFVFPWAHSRRPLYADLHRIQKAAGVRKKAGDGGDEFYGFHDFRRAFGTMNADRMTADALQALMRHQSYTTTQRYINMARQLSPAVENLFVPELDQEKQSIAGKLRDSLS